jgi:hypothetical protein
MSNIQTLKRRFMDYVAGFYTQNAAFNSAIRLKQQHTGRVCRNIVMLGNRLRLSADDLRVAEIMALYHDVGRFRQYAVYRTFRDAASENHALLGIAEIEKNGLLDGLPNKTRERILSAIRWHNTLSIPEGLDDTLRFFIRLLRDADKLDIWKVFTEHYEKRKTHPNKTVELDLPDDGGYSNKVVRDLGNRTVIRMEDLKSLNDFKLLQISWVYDLSFKPTMERLLEKGYLDRIAASLPDTDEICSALQSARAYCSRFMAD